MGYPPKADQYLSEESARQALAWYRTERWKRRGAMLLVAAVLALGCLYLGYTWGVAAERLVSCWP